MLVASIAILTSYQAIPMRTVWTKSFASNNPSSIACNDTTAFALGATGTLLAIELRTGRVLANKYLGKQTPAVTTSGNDSVYAVADGQLCKVRATDLATVWKSDTKIDFPQMGLAIAAGPDGTVAAKRLRGISFFSATDGKSISKQWTAGLGSPGSVPIYIEGGVLFMSGTLALFDHKQEKTVWTAKVGQATGSQTPFYDGTSVFVTSAQGLSRVDARSGKILWNVPGGGISPAVCGTTVVTGGAELRAYDIADGTTRWKVPKLGVISGALKLDDNQVAVMYHRGSSVRVGVFNAADGQLLQESASLASFGVQGHPQLVLTKQGTIVGQYWSTAFCLASGAS